MRSQVQQVGCLPLDRTSSVSAVFLGQAGHIVWLVQIDRLIDTMVSTERVSSAAAVKRVVRLHR